MEKKLLGYYSKKADDAWGHIFYKNDNGEMVKVTTVVSSGAKPISKWKDERFVGYVTEFVESHRSRDSRFAEYAWEATYDLGRKAW